MVGLLGDYREYFTGGAEEEGEEGGEEEKEKEGEKEGETGAQQQQQQQQVRFLTPYGLCCSPPSSFTFILFPCLPACRCTFNHA